MTVALTLRLTEVQHERLRSTSFVLRRPISDLIREAIEGHHWHAEGIWCEECPPAYRVPPMDGTPSICACGHRRTRHEDSALAPECLDCECPRYTPGQQESNG